MARIVWMNEDGDAEVPVPNLSGSGAPLGRLAVGAAFLDLGCPRNAARGLAGNLRTAMLKSVAFPVVLEPVDDLPPATTVV
jgi:hypothetical protein